MKDKTVRTRFAPSPTGMLHIGGLRTALFSWLWARNQGGEFVLRIEDTDQNRLVEGSQQQIMDSMRWLGLDWDFGPDKPGSFGSCVQSERLDSYMEAIQPLLDSGVAYYDWTTPEQLAQMRSEAQAAKKPFVFRKSMATLEGPEGEGVIRIAIPDDIDISWVDWVKGDTSWQGKDIGDFVAIKADGFPTYQFANVVDDHAMGITHVIRADEWMSSTPKHLYLYDQLGWERPIYSHAPPIMGPGGKKKLSKRDGAKDAQEYADTGYLPAAVMNYLALLGWNPGKTEQEIFTVQELIDKFDLSRIQNSGANFDPIRLEWMNGMHIRSLSEADRYESAEQWWPDSAASSTKEHKTRVLSLVYERIKQWDQLDEYSRFFFEEPERPDYGPVAKETGFSAGDQSKLLADTVALLQESDFSEADLEEKFYGYAKGNDLKVGKYFMLIRIMASGSKVAPGLFETLNTLGKKTTLSRLNQQD